MANKEKTYNLDFNPAGTNPIEMFNIESERSYELEGMFNVAVSVAINKAANEAATFTADYIDKQLSERIQNGKKGLVLEFVAPVDIEKECLIAVSELMNDTEVSGSILAFTFYNLGRFKEAIANDYNQRLQFKINEIIKEKLGSEVHCGVRTASNLHEAELIRNQYINNGERDFVGSVDLNKHFAENPNQVIDDLNGTPEDNSPKMQVSWTQGEA
jgi:predicted metal-dependent peptidase